MANKHASLKALFADIADAIREKTREIDSIIADDFPDVIRERLELAPPPCLTFSSPNSFTLAVNDATKHWDGTLEYSTDTSKWSTWDGTTTLSSATSGSDNVLYLRGTGNTKITGLGADGPTETYKWVLTGTDIACVGNIENLLDYATVESGQHPTMATACYIAMFKGCTALIQAPALPATTLAEGCYSGMFFGCTGLTQAPALPATTLASSCYDSMFRGCTSLTKAPALPATTLAEGCYSGMFEGCTSLTQAPALPATMLANYCYQSMFSGCTALTQAPSVLPATTLAIGCYQNMFSDCTSLTQAPALPATTLANYCYRGMFLGCASLTQAPALPATTLAGSCYNDMFYSCTGLKLSSTQTGEYTVAYRTPITGTGTTATDALTDMFKNTGGTFTGTPEINTTYYLSIDNMVVRETEITTLNGYVGAIATPISHANDTDIHVTVEEKTAWNAKTNDIPITSTPADDVKIWIDPNEDDQTENFYTKVESDALLQKKADTTKKASVVLSTNWTGSASPYTQSVTISGTTANSKVDLQPDASVIAQMMTDGTVALYIANDNGTLTAYAVGEKPTVALTIQATIMEVRV